MSPRKQQGEKKPRGAALTEDEIRALPPTVSLVVAGRAWGLGRNLSYELNAAGEFPCDVMKLGERFKVRKSSIMEALGISERRPAGDSIAAPAAKQSAA